jgi:hypothetical protein
VDDRAAVGVEEHDFFAGFDVVVGFVHGGFLADVWMRCNVEIGLGV